MTIPKILNLSAKKYVSVDENKKLIVELIDKTLNFLRPTIIPEIQMLRDEKNKIRIEHCNSNNS